MSEDAKTELMNFIVHQSFYPVLMAERAGPNKSLIEHVQKATHAEVDRYRSFKSAEEVIANFQRDVHIKLVKEIYSELRRLHLPVIDDLQEEFERKARALGFDPETVLRTPFTTTDTGDDLIGQARVSTSVTQHR